MRTSTTLKIAALLISQMLAGAASANLIRNGGFEENPVSYPGDISLAANSTAMPGWTVVGTTISQQTNARFASYGLHGTEGNQYLDLTGNQSRGGGVKSNAITTTTGENYTIKFDIGSFFVGGNIKKNFGTAIIDLAINDKFVASFTNTMDLTNFGSDWITASYTFLANSEKTTFTLTASTSLASSDLGVGLDNVIVTAGGTPTQVPEPGIAGLALSGLLGMAWMRRRKK